LFKEEPTQLMVEALEHSIIYALPKVKLEMVALHNVNIQILYRKILEESLILSQVHADLVRFESAQDRYKKMCKLNPEVIKRTPLIHVASYLQMSPETLSRVRTNALFDR
ncbi:MAG: Crp/Fnr family transcriptional regulator, partial [Prevotella sp.]|nr:Crp/Fnr family transcriptional regulator [Prevotella sp.]